MGMTIDEAIKDIKLISEYLKITGVFDNSTNEKCKPSLDMAIDTMRKYQKIEEIVGNYGFDTSWLCLKKIREVMEDGKID